MDGTDDPATSTATAVDGGECAVCGILVPTSLLALHVNAHFDPNRGPKPPASPHDRTVPPPEPSQRKPPVGPSAPEKRPCAACHQRTVPQPLAPRSPAVGLPEPPPLFRCGLCGTCTVPCAHPGCPTMVQYDPDRPGSAACHTHRLSDVPSTNGSGGAKWCSWCFQRADHPVTQRGVLGRAACACGKCGERTVACRLCPTAMARGHETWDDELCVRCSRVIKEWGAAAAQEAEKAREGWCSWCLAHTRHALVQRNLMSRNVYRCTACGGRTVPCVRCAEGVGRTGVGTTDLQCVKCCQPTNGRVPTSWPQLTEQVRTQFMVARAHNMDLHSVLSEPSAFRRHAHARGLLRPFLLLVAMDPVLRLNCAHVLGWSYAAGEACGDPHAEAWAVLTHRKGLQARVQELHESLAHRPCTWHTILHRTLNLVAHPTAEDVPDPADPQVLRWCQDPSLRVVDAMERQLTHALATLRRQPRHPGGGGPPPSEPLDDLMAQLVVEEERGYHGGGSPVPHVLHTPDRPAAPMALSSLEAPHTGAGDERAGSMGDWSQASPGPLHLRTTSATRTPLAGSGHPRTLSAASTSSTLSVSGGRPTAVLTPVVVMEGAACPEGEGAGADDVLEEQPQASPPPTPGVRNAPPRHGTSDPALDGTAAAVMGDLSEGDALRAFVQRMAAAGVTEPPLLTFALQTVLQLLDVLAGEAAPPPFLATLAAAAAPFVPPHPGPGPQSAVKRRGSTTSNPDATSASPLSMISWMWHVLDLHILGIQPLAQALAVVMHLLHQKLLLAAQGYALEDYYGPGHPSGLDAGPLPPLPAPHPQVSGVSNAPGSEGRFVGDGDHEAEGTVRPGDPPPEPPRPGPTAPTAPVPKPSGALKALGDRLEERMKGLLKAVAAAPPPPATISPQPPPS